MKSKFVSLTLAGVVLVSVFAASSGKAMAAAPMVEPGPPGSVQMLQEPLDEIDGVIQQGITDRYMAGSVVLAAKSGTIVKEDAYGYAARSEEHTSELQS